MDESKKQSTDVQDKFSKLQAEKKEASAKLICLTAENSEIKKKLDDQKVSHHYQWYSQISCDIYPCLHNLGKAILYISFRHDLLLPK